MLFFQEKLSKSAIRPPSSREVARRSRDGRSCPQAVEGVMPLPHSTNPSPSASMMTKLTAMETELVKLASAVSPWQRSV